jgi:hypothetical protein
MSHGRTECKVCNKVLLSCRCMEAHSNVTYVVCEECQKPKPKTYAQMARERAENAPMSSSQHGHSVSELREYCERELDYAYGAMVPELVRRLERACEVLKDSCVCIGGGLCWACAPVAELEAIPEEGR